ncbi:AAA domain-containing protein [Nocardiopsis sp. RSe5-2]|uniref:AAA domain-containing protein n=1 Tax=Nocardiopsis endophytica TaxID=3018445 RepID=A0ABT4U128_9ACTN|nr:AAA domain-containing protein [Nocardiopsis endophytica]MDA2810645.1 AAA domain-containing protein [Nocardiopsis endophytica]
MKRTALLIGATSYRELSDLKSPRADVDALEKVLKAQGHFDRVRPLHDPHRAEAVEAIEDVLAEAGPGDLVVLSFSGHGLRNSRGRLHFAFGDTRSERLESTGLPAESLQRMLKESRAASKVVLLDCCYSGAFADRFATRSGAGAEEHPDFERQMGAGESAGTYVLASSGALEYAYEGANTGGTDPSPFTAAVVRGLSGAADDSDGDGWIDALDLYQYVHRQVDGQGRQRVTHFNLGASGRLKLSRHAGAATGVALGDPAPPEAEEAGAGRDGVGAANGHAGGGAVHEPDRGGAERPWDTRQWAALFDYYRSCLDRQSVLQQLPDLGSALYAVVGTGRELLLSGESEQVELTGDPARIADGARREGQSLRYGYPAVLFTPVHGKKKGRTGSKVAPLLVMDVEVREDGGRGGVGALVPVGDPELNQEVLLSAADLGEEEIEELLAWFEADWAGQGVAGLADKVRALCGRLGLRQVQNLVPGRLEERLETGRPLTSGARNAAMLYAADPAASAVGQLSADLDHRSGSGLKTERIASTALAALADPAVCGDARRAGGQRPVITGLSNSAQERIQESSMRETLTVATGAPGTGKSELITAVVTTAVAGGESVLVASTNNTAVDEVVDRANRLLPGADLIVRTGNADKKSKEADILGRLRAARLDSSGARTAAERLDLHQRSLGAGHEALEEIGALEHRLAALAPTREGDRARVAEDVALDDAFPDLDSVRRWAHRVGAARERRWTGWFYRWLVRRSLHYGRDEAELEALAAFLDTESEWRRTHARLDRIASPEDAYARIRQLREERRGDGKKYVVAQVARARDEGVSILDERLDNLAARRSTWVGMDRLVRVVRAWATTSRSARVFKPKEGLFDLVVIDEASQCTIADLIPLLFRAKRALIIGDPHQLQPVNSLDASEDRRIQAASGLDEDWLDERSLVYTRSSAYHAAASALARAGRDVLWLDEHYRCHPDIVVPVNRRFYGNRLAVRTRTTGLAAPADRAVTWVDVKGLPERPEGGSCRNPDEAQEVLGLLRELWTDLPADADIGVVTPFAAQKRELERLLGGKAGERIRVGTVHTFQGGERDVMVVSPTAATGVERGAGRWAVRQQNLWNVAVTRARSRLYVVGDRAYWSEQGGLLADLAAHALSPAEEDAPDEARNRLFEALTDGGGSPEAGPVVNGYSCDLLVSGSRGEVAVIVDGAGIGDPAQPGSEAALERILGRAALFQEVSGVRTVRVPAWRCWAEPDAVAMEILSDAG